MGEDEYFEMSRNAINKKKYFSMRNYCDLFINLYKTQHNKKI